MLLIHILSKMAQFKSLVKTLIDHNLEENVLLNLSLPANQKKLSPKKKRQSKI